MLCRLSFMHGKEQLHRTEVLHAAPIQVLLTVTIAAVWANPCILNRATLKASCLSALADLNLEPRSVQCGAFMFCAGSFAS